MHDVHGSTAKTEIPQSLFNFAGEEGKSQAQVTHKKERATGRTVSPFGLRFEDIEQDGDPRWGLRVAYVDRGETAAGAGNAKAVRAFEETKERIVALVREDRTLESANAICARVTGTRTIVLQALKELVREGRLATPDESRKTFALASGTA